MSKYFVIVFLFMYTFWGQGCEARKTGGQNRDSSREAQATVEANAVQDFAANGPRLVVKLGEDRHPISPDIYGINFGPEELVANLKIPTRRWGGNATTRYNWKLDSANHASDWFFENLAMDDSDLAALPDGSEVNDYILFNQQYGTKTLVTVPLIGWTPKSRELACGFSIEKYGVQAQNDTWHEDCGNGVRPDGSPVTGNDPTDTSIAIGPDFVVEWVTYLVERFGSAANGGVSFYGLDNEPMLWHVTHRDVHPSGVSAEELRNLTYQYARAVKQGDPTAATFGPVLWGWSAYFQSAEEQLASAQGGWGQLGSLSNDQSLVGRYLDDMRAYEEAYGLRILDYLDLHFFVQAPNVTLAPAGDEATQALRLRSTRALWDANYVDESWIDEPVYLIPRMREWVAAHYPGTKISLSEYNWGALDDMNGALAQADVLGIFGREQLDNAMLWAPLDADQPYAFAFRMYLNYDGLGSKFGDVSVRAESSDVDRVGIYAAERQRDQALTILVINKTNELMTSELSIAGVSEASMVRSFVYDANSLDAIMPGDTYQLLVDAMNLSLPPASIMLLEVSPDTASVPKRLGAYLPFVEQ